MTQLMLRAALAGCAAAGLAVAQPQAPTPPPIHVQPPVPTQPMTPKFVPSYGCDLPAAKTVLKTFDVADLVCPPADSPLVKPGTDPAMIAAAKAFADVRGEELLKAVRAGTDRTTWDEYGGSGKLLLTTDGKTLVVNCPESTADKIGECVKSLRTARGSHVKVEMTVFTVPSGNEAMVKLFGDKLTAPVSVDEMTRVLRELKSSGAVDILTRPTLVMQNKQTGFCQTGQVVRTPGCPATCETMGMTSRVTPEVSADLKSILLAMELQQTAPLGGHLGGFSSQQTQTTMVVPDGGSMAMKLGTWKLERKVETKVPVVGDVPYIGRLFRNVGISTEPTDTVAVVTATRLNDAPCPSPPTAAQVPTMMPTAVPFSTPLAAPTPVMLPLPIRTVGADGLERVGGNFNTLTTPVALPPVGVRMTTPAGVSFTRFAPADASCVAGGVIGVTVSRAAECDDTTTLMAAYKAACAAGRTDDAARLALKLLAKDPTCFGK